MMSKTQRFSKGYSSGFIPDYRHAVETVGDSVGLEGSVHVDSEDSCSPKRKCISLNTDAWGTFNIPLKLISLSKMSPSEKRNLEMTLRAELEQIQMFQKKISSRSIEIVTVPSAPDILGKKDVPAVQTPRQTKRGISGRFESVKQVPPPSSVSNTSIMVMKQCETLLKRLMSHQFAWVFNTPVDVVKLKIPDYFTVIKHPMDLGTIKSKLAAGAYSSPWEFVSDVRLTFNNAMTYNPPGNDVHIMADTLSKYFEVRWKSIEKKLSGADAGVSKQNETSKPVAQPKKARAPPAKSALIAPDSFISTEKRMTEEQKHKLSRNLESLGDLPDHIVEFLRRNSGSANQMNEEEIEIDIDSLSDSTLSELQNLLDDYLREQQQAKSKVHEKQALSEQRKNSSSVQPIQENVPTEEDVDIGGNDPPTSSYPPVEIEKDAAVKSSKYSSSSSSSDDSDSDSASSSGSESDVAKASTPTARNGIEETGGAEIVLDQERIQIMIGHDLNREADQAEQNAHPKVTSDAQDACQDGENAPSERQASPGKLYRAALLKSRFADTILKAREKAFDKTDKGDPEKLRREREELERLQREEKARLQAEAKAAEYARKQAESVAAAEARQKRELEREAARQALLKMEKTVDINENSQFLKDLEMLGTVPVEHLPSSVDETSPDHSLEGLGGFQLGGVNPLEQLGLYMKVDDEEEEEPAPHRLPPNDTEEGEID